MQTAVCIALFGILHLFFEKKTAEKMQYTKKVCNFVAS